MELNYSYFLRLAAGIALASNFARAQTASPAQPVSGLPIPANPLSIADTQAQIQTLRGNERSEQSAISRGLHSGTASPADIAAAANAIQQVQSQRLVLEKHAQQLAKQKFLNDLAAGTADPLSAAGNPASSTASPLAATIASGSNGTLQTTTVPISASPVILPEQQAVLDGRQVLFQQFLALKNQSPTDSQAMTNLVSQWQAANAATLAQADQARATAAAARRAKVLARLLATPAQTIATAGEPPKMQALRGERAAAARDLQILFLQSNSMTAEQKNAAFALWETTHAQTLDQLTVQSAAETKALGVAGVAKAAAAERAAASANSSLPQAP